MAITNRDIDKRELSIPQYIDKYYSNVDLKGWKYWMTDNIRPAWEREKRKEFLAKWGERMKFFDFAKMENFYEKRDLSGFDEDVKKFVAFLAGDGFFDKNNLTFEDWINSKNFTNPLKDYEQDVTIKEALSLKGGMNYIRKQLINLHWWRQ
ncbi:MAG: hypothetical protein HC896_01735 [Bacteroidales bacterium]|nr:hypothetical protein [Bacteroidales bacterium]